MVAIATLLLSCALVGYCASTIRALRLSADRSRRDDPHRAAGHAAGAPDSSNSGIPLREAEELADWLENHGCQRLSLHICRAGLAALRCSPSPDSPSCPSSQIERSGTVSD